MGVYGDLMKISQAEKARIATATVKDETAAEHSPVEMGSEKKTSKQVDKQTSKLVNKFASKHAYINRFLSDKAFITASFRLPPELLRKFDEVYYLANSRYRSDFKKYAVVVTALGLLFWDFETNGKESELYRLLVAKSSR